MSRRGGASPRGSPSKCSWSIVTLETSPTVYPLKGLSMSALRHNKGDPVKLERMQRFMKKVVQVGMREGIDMTGELEERKLGGRYDVVLENMTAKKTEKHARRKKELLWETFNRH